MVYQWQEAGQQRQLPFVIYLPEGYRPGTKLWPLLTFLSGMGERGSDPSVVMNCGVPVDVGDHPELQKWMPMILLMPVCPSDRMWDSPDMPPAVLRLIHAAAETWDVDASRLYLTGLSMGGMGSWAVGKQAPDLFAVVAPIASAELDPQGVAKALHGSGTTCLVISGMDDIVSQPDSQHMVEALKAQAVDVTYAPIPHGQHYVWSAYYGNREFYEWLLLHRRGAPIPKDRPSGDYLAGLFLAEAPASQQVRQRLQKELDQFLPYWFIDNCSAHMDPGLKPLMQGRTNVFVTYPLTLDVGCRLQTTMKLPKDKPAYLKLTIGRHPEGEWRLLVRANEQEIQRLEVNRKTAPDGWTTVDVDLNRFAGGDARIQLVNQATGIRNASAYWAQVQVIQQ
jgi:dienelactone hydrolase